MVLKKNSLFVIQDLVALFQNAMSEHDRRPKEHTGGEHSCVYYWVELEVSPLGADDTFPSAMRAESELSASSTVPSLRSLAGPAQGW